MKSSTKKVFKYGSVAAVTAGLAATTTYFTTRLLVKYALDREVPKIMKNAEEKIAGASMDGEFMKELKVAAESLGDMPHKTVEIFGGDSTKLVGHWFETENAKRTIIAVHGWRSSWCRDFGMVADFWLNNGCNVLFVEQRGQNNSDGDHMGFGLIERYDCLDWIKWVNGNTEDGLPIYLCGVSMGATTVLMATGLELPDSVHGVIADCGFTSPNDIWKHVANKNLHITYGLTGVIADYMCKQKIQMGSKDYSAVNALENSKVPVLFVHGSDDKFVPITMTYKNYKACQSQKRLLVVPGADHGMSYYVDRPIYEKTVLEFFKDFD